MQEVLLMAVLLELVITIIVLFQFRSTKGFINSTLINTNSRLDKLQERLEQTVREEVSRNREETSKAIREAREELNVAMKSFEQSVVVRIAEMTNFQKNQLELVANQIANLTKSNEQRLENVRTIVETRLKELTEETRKELKTNGDTVSQQMATMASLQQNQLENFSRQMSNLTQSTEIKLDQLKENLDQRVKELQKENTEKLDQMRAVVDEKLHATLEQRLGESFKLVSDRLEKVHQGLGEMQALASGVGDLKKVLTNIKTRGTWGEVQLGNILEDILSPDQYATNIAIKQGTERVEFAIKLPGRDQGSEPVWLPIDAKFPLEDYQKLLEAYDQADTVLVEQLSKQLEYRVKAEAKEISSKYIAPPASTDFAIMFVPTEGLYAEILRRPGLFEELIRDYRVTVAGPTTLAALVNSLSMGFRTLAIQQRSSEVWSVLGAVKTEFGKFGHVLEKTQKKLQEASNTIDEAKRRSRVMERKLRTVEALPENQAVALLGEDEYANQIASDMESD
ncbi:MAG: DNA recombination protein RmuC [Syntrophomonadaceae bacterium]